MSPETSLRKATESSCRCGTMDIRSIPILGSCARKYGESPHMHAPATVLVHVARHLPTWK